MSLCLVIGAAHATPAQDETAPTGPTAMPLVAGKTTPAVRLEKAPIIDGVLSPGEWQGASVITDMHQTNPGLGVPPEKETIIYIAYDDDFIYVGARMFDDEPEKIVAERMVQGNPTFGDDRFVVILSPFNNKRSGYRFGTNPNGIRQEALADGPDGYNFDWQAIWNTAAQIDDKGWTAEFAIPFKTLNFDPTITDWGLGFGRIVARTGERVAWTSFNGRVTAQALGQWTGVTGAKQGVGLDIVGNLIPRFAYDDENSKTSVELNPAVDLFYKFTPSLTGVFTANTDFSTTDVDDQIVNLTRFSIRLPERRDFFLQDADIFSFADLNGNANPFFSRTIGLDEDGAPLNLIAGGKVAGRIGDLNLGALNVFQEQGDGTGNANLFVGRASYNIFDNSNFGAIFTLGDPVTGRQAMTYGADIQYRRLDWIDGAPVEFNLFYLDTKTPTEDREEDYRGDTATYGVSARINAREGIQFFSRYRVIEPDYNPALGFVNRVGTENFRIFLSQNWRPSEGFLSRIEMSARYNVVNDIDGGLQSESVSLRPLGLTSRRGDQLEFFYETQREVLEESFEIVDDVFIPIGRYSFDRIRMFLDTASSRPLGISMTVAAGSFFGGDRFNWNTDFRYTPNRFITTALGFNSTEIDVPGGRFTTRVASLRTDVAFNAKWSWITRVQYDNVSDSGGVNSRLRYNPAPGQDFFLVINQGFEQRDELDDFGVSQRRLRATDTNLAIRLTYTLRF